MQYTVSDMKIDDYYPDLSYSNLLKTLLYQKGFSKEDAQAFLSTVDEELEDSAKIYGIKKAAKVIEERITEGGKIVIHGDFDVDGVCATSILFDYLYFKRGVDVFPIIPNRADEGYGLSDKTIEKALNLGTKLIISVDCGIKDYEIVEKYKKQVDFVITDHHQFRFDEKDEILLPKAKAVVHSAHPKSKFSTMISGAATAWELVRELEKLQIRNYELRERSSVIPDLATAEIRNLGINETTPGNTLNSRLRENDKIDISQYLDLVALSTVCDIIPLTKENRKLVQKGMKVFSETSRIGLKKLADISEIDLKKVEAYHFGFVIGPRLNAPGRVTNDATDSLKLLLTKKLDQASELAMKLHDLNAKRQDMTKKYLELAKKQIDLNKKAILVTGEEWPEGILGLVASKLAEEHYRPVLVASVDKDGKITGSSRSPLESFSLNKALEHAKEHLTRFGGHKMAAGFASNKDIFYGFEDKILEFIELNTVQEDFIKRIEADIEIADFTQITPDSILDLKKLEPFGIGNPKPKFLFRNCQIIEIQEFGKTYTHLKLILKHNNSIITAKGFNCVGKYPNLELNQKIDLLGHLSLNEWNNRMTIEVDIVDIQIQDVDL